MDGSGNPVETGDSVVPLALLHVPFVQRSSRNIINWLFIMRRSIRSVVLTLPQCRVFRALIVNQPFAALVNVKPMSVLLNVCCPDLVPLMTSFRWVAHLEN